MKLIINLNLSVKTEAAAIAQQKSYCTGNFSVCRKYEDDVVTAISACSQSSAKLVYKAKALKANIDSLTAMKATVAAKLGTGRTSRQRAGRAVPTSCAEMTVKVSLVITMMIMMTMMIMTIMILTLPR